MEAQQPSDKTPRPTPRPTPPPKGHDLPVIGNPLLPTPRPDTPLDLTMPRHDHDNTILARVAADYGLTAVRLSAATNIDASHISRVLSGQYAAPPTLLRVMWHETRDQRVARVALGDSALEQIRNEPVDQRLELALQTSAAMSDVGEGLTRLAAGEGQPAMLRRDMAELSRKLRALDALLQTPTQTASVPA